MSGSDFDLCINKLTCSKDRRFGLLFNKHLSDCQFLVGTPKPADPSPETSTSSQSPECSPSSQSSESDNDVVTEAVAQQTFYVHKMLLAMTSEVFERMFYGEFPTENPIRVEGVRPKIFEVFLKYVYTYEMNADHLTIPELTELINVGQMYMIKDCVDACVAQLKKRNWNVEHVIPMYEVACLYNNLPLMLHCYKKFRINASHILYHYTFLEMNVSYMQRFVVVMSELLPFMTILRALENYASRLYRDSEEYDTLVEAALSMNFHKLTYLEFSSGPAMSFLFRNRVEELRKKFFR